MAPESKKRSLGVYNWQQGCSQKPKACFFFRGEMARVHCLQSRQAAHQLGQRRQNGELPQIQHYHHLMQSRQAAHPPRHHRQPGARQIQLLLLTNSPSHSSSTRCAFFFFCTLSSRTSSLKHHTSPGTSKSVSCSERDRSTWTILRATFYLLVPLQPQAHGCMCACACVRVCSCACVRNFFPRKVVCEGGVSEYGGVALDLYYSMLVCYLPENSHKYHFPPPRH